MPSDFQDELGHLEAQLREANQEINRRSGRPLLPAILTGLVLGGIVIGGFFFKPLFYAFGVAIIGLAAFELATALRSSGRRIPRVAVVTVSAGMMVVAAFGEPGWQWLALLAAAVLLTLWRVAETLAPRFRASVRQVGRDIGASLFALLYVTFLASFIPLLLAQERGEWWVIGFLIVVIAIDIAAYAVGLTLGRHPMAPTISPKKSWEGFAGGAAAAVASGIVVAVFLLGQPWWVGIVFGVTLLVTGTMGDLAESLIKRDLGVKDMSNWLPGHGGVLDRLDAIILSGPAAYGLYLIFAG